MGLTNYQPQHDLPTLASEVRQWEVWQRWGRLVVGGWWNQVAGTNLDLEYIEIESTIFEATGFCWFLGVKQLLMEIFHETQLGCLFSRQFTEKNKKKLTKISRKHLETKMIFILILGGRN